MRQAANCSFRWLIGIAAVCALLVHATVGVIAATPTPPKPAAPVRKASTVTPYGIGIFRVVNGAGIWALRDSASAGDPTNVFAYGLGTDTPLMCDWDGNGTRTAGIVRTVNGYLVWAYRNSNSGAPPDGIILYGVAGDTPICGGNAWALRNSNSAGNPDIFVYFGQNSPIVGDWTGQSKETVGTVGVEQMNPFRARTWLMSNTDLQSGIPDFTFRYGLNGDIPLVYK